MAGLHPEAAADEALDIAQVVLAHLDRTDPLVPWATSLADGAVEAELAGHLTGSIDLVLRHRRPDGPDRFVVVDYKTNRLADGYGQPSLVAAMAHHHYPLQALLYCVALHRYLRWRLVGYRPEVHLGGAGYLFLRGMTGPDVASPGGRPDGVFHWATPAGLVTALSDLLDGARSLDDASAAPPVPDCPPVARTAPQQLSLGLGS